MTSGRTYGLSYFNGINANIRNEAGQTPLMLASANGHTYVVEMLGKAQVDVWAKDNDGKTAFDYIKVPTNSREKMFSDRMYGSLRMLEVRQIIRGKASFVLLDYKNTTDILKIVIQDALCQDFKFPKNTQCKSR